ncbi:hypothetical protein BDV34DRAFT_222263 [Aspergillus parasiticus]|uniref:Uncharacterized protein n=1 Tax=Aspergillus parasiticus TaxID=5067 RepID=A0A5N6DTX9_ASPPA|nr:hypothetical protein BDV34DRAFT_222263 [Aspergillus parasiticus]
MALNNPPFRQLSMTGPLNTRRDSESMSASSVSKEDTLGHGYIASLQKRLGLPSVELQYVRWFDEVTPIEGTTKVMLHPDWAQSGQKAQIQT